MMPVKPLPKSIAQISLKYRLTDTKGAVMEGLCATGKTNELRQHLRMVAEDSCPIAQILTAKRCIRTLYQGMLWADDLVLPSRSLSLIDDEGLLGIFHCGYCDASASAKVPHLLIAPSPQKWPLKADECVLDHKSDRVETIILLDKQHATLYSSFGEFHLRRWCVVPAIVHILSYYAGYNCFALQAHADRLAVVDRVNRFIKQCYPNYLELFYTTDSPLNVELDRDMSGLWVKEFTRLLKVS